ncbi:hypothetical protein ThesuDRAFT_00132 [Thermaerobacter subterraneus DSM 13965]|uniref:Uncharacterized protein n=1 Tax=Thermaerobacter subterraneus DSM 13965 TaxID=867903 RepID=K6PYR9_9FIRM|nr:hypothetical protein ThesuDRAFT_00132 [Thermaerobacter subterraneus DSM 13965]
MRGCTAGRGHLAVKAQCEAAAATEAWYAQRTRARLAASLLAVPAGTERQALEEEARCRAPRAAAAGRGPGTGMGTPGPELGRRPRGVDVRP